MAGHLKRHHYGWYLGPKGPKSGTIDIDLGNEAEGLVKTVRLTSIQREEDDFVKVRRSTWISMNEEITKCQNIIDGIKEQLPNLRY